MLKPINGHVLVEPLVHESFISSQKETYEEIGTVIDFEGSDFSTSSVDGFTGTLQKGCKVYFDSWLAAKYPRKDKEGEYYWLVKYEDIRAVEYD